MIKKFVKSTSFLFFTCILSSCAITHSEYRAINKIETFQKSPESVEYFVTQPKRSAMDIGMIGSIGNGYASHQDVVLDARKKAASMGGDFILEVGSGTDKETIVNPGYSTYTSNGNASVNGGAYSIYGSANQQASGYSVGPSISTIVRPWSVFSVWVYKPSQSGIEMTDDFIITRFHLNSDGESNGLKLGDKVIGIDGIDIADESLPQHIMEVMPGDKMLYSVSRDGKRIDCSITVLSN